jgi:hypothetical protein
VQTETTEGQTQQLYVKSADLTKIRDVQINCWKKNYNIWDGGEETPIEGKQGFFSNETPILHQFHIGITKKISQYVNY